jgi:hypothetical protein
MAKSYCAIAVTLLNKIAKVKMLIFFIDIIFKSFGTNGQKCAASKFFHSNTLKARSHRLSELLPQNGLFCGLIASSVEHCYQQKGWCGIAQRHGFLK